MPCCMSSVSRRTLLKAGAVLPLVEAPAGAIRWTRGRGVGCACSRC